MRFTSNICFNSIKIWYYAHLVIKVTSVYSGLNKDSDENENHLINILKDHEIIPDIIDDAAHADILQVCILY